MNSRRHSTNVVPMIGSPPTPMQVDWPRPARVSRSTTSYVSVPEREIDSDAAFFENVARHDADERLSGRSEARTVGPDDAHAAGRSDDLERIVDRYAFGNADGERDARVVGFVERVGRKRRRDEDAGVRRAGCVDGFSNRIEDRQVPGASSGRLCPGVTPPTMFVPYLCMRSVWYEPSAPVIPWTMTLLFLST